MREGEIIAERFEIEGLAGSGGMADVYAARDRTSGVRIALKILRATGPEDLARLAREAQALSRLRHAGIVQYVAHGSASDSEPFVAMEWIEGETLSKRLRDGPLTIAHAIALTRALASALGHAHEHGIVHRDVKPGNVMLRAGDVLDPILLDFGVARTGLAVGLTQLGTIIGTPRYMAPEQARGGQAVDARADVFALGSLMFKCITGRAPFDGDDAIAVLAHLLFDDAPDVCDLAPSTPRAVGDVLTRMLAKEPGDRYADGAAVVRALDALDTSAMPVTIAAAAASGLTLRERRLLSLMVLSGKVDVDVARTVANDYGGKTEALANGSVVVVVSGGENATELARVSARCAIELRHALPEAPIVLATGRGDDVHEDATQTMSGDGSGSSRYSGVFERAAGLLRHERDARALGPLPIVIDDTTAGLLGADFDVARGAGGNPHALRGRADKRAQYTLLGKATPFVGRARELSALLATWADVREQGVARAMLVTADAGLGKSRLLYEMLAATKQHEQPTLALVARADATTAGSPFAALGAAVRREVGITDDERATEKWNKLAARVGSVTPEGETHVAEFVAEVAGLRLADPGEQVAAARRDPRLMGDRIRRSWQTWIRGEAARGSVLIVLEDFQWGDLPTVKLVDEMLRDLAEEPIFVLALARSDVDAAFPNLWARIVVHLPLLGLPKKAAAAFARAMLDDASAETVDRIVSLASGNALHLEELVRAAAEGKTDAPESLLAMLSSQIESLPDAERRLLRAASVFGSVFWTDGVCALLAGATETTERTRSEANALLDALARRELLSTRGASRFPGERQLEFRNALVRDVTYAMLTEDDRRLGHALAADWLARAGESDPFVLAEHYARGARSVEALAEYTRSARAALDAGDFAMVCDRVERAMACGATGPELGSLLVMSAEAHRWRGETRECALDARRARDESTPGTQTYFRALRLYAYAASFMGDLAELVRTAETFLASRPTDDTLVEWAFAVGQTANALTLTGHLAKNEEMVRHIENVAAARATTDPDVVDTLRMCRGLRAYGRGDFETLAEVHREGAAFRLKIGDVREQMVRTSNVGFALMWLGRMQEALDAFETAREGARRLELATLELNAIQNTAFIRYCQGATDAAIDGSREVLRRAEIEAPRSMSLAHLCMSRALLRRGKLEEALVEALAGTEHAPTIAMRMYSRAVLADVLLGMGRIADACATSHETVADLRTIPNHAVGDVLALVVRAECLDAHADREGALDAILEARALLDGRRALIHGDEARRIFDTQNPDAPRLYAAYDRLVT